MALNEKMIEAFSRKMEEDAKARTEERREMYAERQADRDRMRKEITDSMKGMSKADRFKMLFSGDLG